MSDTSGSKTSSIKKNTKSKQWQVPLQADLWIKQLEESKNIAVFQIKLEIPDQLTSLTKSLSAAKASYKQESFIVGEPDYPHILYIPKGHKTTISSYLLNIKVFSIEVKTLPKA